MSQPVPAETGRIPALRLRPEKAGAAETWWRPPFACHLSLEPLLDWWTREAQEDCHGLAETARALLGRVEEARELRGDLQDPAILQTHSPLVAALLSALVPPAVEELACSAVAPPFGGVFLRATPRFRKLFLDAEGHLRGRPVAGGATLSAELIRSVFVYLVALNEAYNLEIPFRNAQHLAVPDPQTGLDAFFQMRLDLEFCRVRPVGPLPDLDPEAMAALREDITNLQAWNRLLPPERFEISGLVIYEANEVTTEVALSQIKQLLMERNALEDEPCSRQIEDCMRILLRRPEICVLVALTQGKNAWFLQPGGPLERPVEERSASLAVEDFQRALEEGWRRDGSALAFCRFDPASSGLHKALGQQGFCRAVMAPLVYAEETVGYLVVASDQEDAFSSLEATVLREVIPLFALALWNRAEVLRERVRSVIKEHFTAIHPAVEWRFEEAALRWLRRQTDHGEVEPIVFSQVHPLYGVSDIRSSSDIRMQSIQEDLHEQLALAGSFLEACQRSEPLPYLEHLIHVVNRTQEDIRRQGLCSGQETTLLEFLNAEVEALFPSFTDPAAAQAARRYREALDPVGFVYRRRRDFEESVSRIRELVGGILLEEQVRAQQIFPHYFEMHKTDGVDHMIYVGASLSHRKGFQEVHLRSLRIWQVQTMVRIARETEALREDLPIPLGTAHLILVQHSPLAIRFMMDDRRFDVDGAYNARYEIVKKRLDKAELRSTGERLTQPGHLALVYSHPREAAESRDYLQALVESGDLEGEVEDHELRDLQGVQGLRALRVKVRCL
jgi:hypothetical protein